LPVGSCGLISIISSNRVKKSRYPTLFLNNPPKAAACTMTDKRVKLFSAFAIDNVTTGDATVHHVRGMGSTATVRGAITDWGVTYRFVRRFTSVSRNCQQVINFFYIFAPKQSQMFFRTATTIKLILVLMMSLDILGASLAVLPSTSDSRLNIHAQRPASSIFGSFLFEQADVENENAGGENDHHSRVVAIDFSRVVDSLNASCRSELNLSVRAFRNYGRPPLHQLYCVFLI